MIEQLDTTFLEVKGKIKKFGEDGVYYLVGDIVETLEDGDCMVSIIILESGESTVYRLSKIFEDMEAE